MMISRVQKSVNRVAAALPVYFVFKSGVHYDMYMPTSDGMLIFNGDTYKWDKSEFQDIQELVNKFNDKYPIYANSQIFNALDWEQDESVASLTNKSLADWL